MIEIDEITVEVDEMPRDLQAFKTELLAWLNDADWESIVSGDSPNVFEIAGGEIEVTL